jgi:hypothetical protein
VKVVRHQAVREQRPALANRDALDERSEGNEVERVMDDRVVVVPAREDMPVTAGSVDARRSGHVATLPTKRRSRQGVAHIGAISEQFFRCV